MNASLPSPIGASFPASIQSLSTLSNPTGGEIIGTNSAGGGVSVVAVSAMLDQAMEELFVPYMEGNRYLEKEGKSLTELYAGKLLRFTNWHVCLQIFFILFEYSN